MLKTLKIQGKFKDDFKYENTFFEIQPKITQKDIFGRRSRDLIIDISFLHKIMQLDKYPKIPKSDIFAPKFKAFISQQTLHLGKFKGTDFHYDNTF